MKFKPKLDTARLKTFLVQHVEKIGLIVCAIVLLASVGNAIWVETYPREPADLDRSAADAAAHMQNQRFADSGESLVAQLPNAQWSNGQIIPFDYVGLVQDALSVELNEGAYELASLLNPPLWPQSLRRGVPNYLPPRELQVGALNGAIAINKTAGSTAARSTEPSSSRGGSSESSVQVQGVSVAVVTALVPLADQAAEYKRVFGEARFRDPERDRPRYAGFAVEVREINDTGPGQWREINIEDAIKFEQSWANSPAEVVDGRYVNAQLTGPLPPLVRDTWDPKLISHPKVQLLKTAETSAAPEEVQTEPETRPEPASGGPPGRRPPGRGTGDQPPATSPQNNPSTTPTQRREPETAGPTGLLFRFFDFNVQPGRQYQYRVKLWLHNPNHALPDVAVEDMESTKESYVQTEWSEPSPIVRVPTGTTVVLGPVAENNRQTTANLALQVFQRELGEYRQKVFELVQGTYINHADLPGADADAADGNTDSGYVLVDLRGTRRAEGEPPDAAEPGEVLLLNLDGTLTVRRESGDRQAFEKIEASKSSSEARSTEPDKATPGGRTPTAIQDLLGTGGR